MLLSSRDLNYVATSVSLVFLILVTFAMLIRTYTKWRILRDFTLEDYPLTLSYLVYAIGYTTLGCIFAEIRFGAYQSEVPEKPESDQLRVSIPHLRAIKMLNTNAE